MISESAAQSIELRIEPPSQAAATADHIPLRIVFENVGDTAVRLLREFEPLPVFFSFGMTRADGTPISLPGAGKISFYENALTYIELAAREAFSLTIDLADLIPSEASVTPGLYTVSASYHNQYGEDCFQGWIESEPIQITIAARSETDP